MRWRTLIPLSLAFAVTVGVALGHVDRSLAQEPPPNCGMVSGDDCDSKCMRECSDGSCCHWRHYNYLS